VSECLADTIRSQGFSPSQRFEPARAVWLYFTPLPPIGFSTFRVFPTQTADPPFDGSSSHAVERDDLVRQAGVGCRVARAQLLLTIPFQLGSNDHRGGHLRLAGQGSQEARLRYCALDFRVLIRLSVRTHPSSVTLRWGADTLLAFTLSKAYLLDR
jgi:hypothetical protein